MSRRRRLVLLPLGLALLVAACGSTIVTPAPGATAVTSSGVATPSTGASPAASGSAPATAAAGTPGSIVVQPCPNSTQRTLCLSDESTTVRVPAAPGKPVALSLVVRNPGDTPSAPIAVLLHVADADGKLPLGQPDCTTCNSTATSKVIGLEWPALAPGETRTVSVDIPVTGPGGTFAADLYARPLADVMADQIANGITPGQQTWTVDLAVSG